MANFSVLFVVAILVTVISVQGYTLNCRKCHHVRHPLECTKIEHCHNYCNTKVELVHGEYLFSYSCEAYSHCSNTHGQACVECCATSNCDLHTCSQFFQSALTTSTTTTTTTPKPTTTTSTTPKPTTTALVTTTEQIVSKGCNNLDVLGGLVKGTSVSHPGTKPCPDGTHQPSESLVQEYCGAPSLSQWISGVNVVKNCPRIPRYTAIAASTSIFGGSTIAGVFLECEPNGFQAAIQTCGTELKLRHLSTNSTSNIPSAEKFVVINW